MKIEGMASELAMDREQAWLLYGSLRELWLKLALDNLPTSSIVDHPIFHQIAWLEATFQDFGPCWADTDGVQTPLGCNDSMEDENLDRIYGKPRGAWYSSEFEDQMIAEIDD